MFRFEPISDKFSEAAVCRCSAKYVFLKIKENSLENIRTEYSEGLQFTKRDPGTYYFL